MEFAKPHFFWLFLIFVPLIAWYIWKLRKQNPAMRTSSIAAVAALPTSYRALLRHLLFVLRLGALACLIVILCRPQVHSQWKNTNVEGTDIIIAMDISTSMLAQDFTPDRFGAAKEVASKFVNGRQSDNIGLVVFAGESFTLLPMTADKSTLLNAISTLEMGFIEDGTAIGDGLATSINRLVDGKAKSKSIILLTDGSNNTGLVAPLAAADIAKQKGIKMYTIGVCKNGSALSPVGINPFGKIEYDYLKVTIDENTLRSIASSTGGKYFRAVDNATLQNIFKEIDSLEKTEMDVESHRNVEDNYMLWAWLLLGFVGLELLLRHTVMRTLP